MPTLAEELEELRRKAVTKSNAGKLKNAKGLNTPTDVEEALKQKTQKDKVAKKQAADILHSFNEAKQVDQDSDMRLKQTAQKKEDQEKKKQAADILHSFNDAKAAVVVPKKLAPQVESSKEEGAGPSKQAGTEKPEKPVVGEPGAEAPVVEGNPEAVVDNKEEKSKESEAAREDESAVEVPPPTEPETVAAPEEANSAAPMEEFDAEKITEEPAMEEPTATTKDVVAEEPVTEEDREESPVPADETDGEAPEAGIDAVLSPSHPHNDHTQHNEHHHHHHQQQPTETEESVEEPVLEEPAGETTAAVEEKMANEPVADEPAPVDVEMAHKSHQPTETGESVEEPVLEESADETTAAVEEKLANEPVADKPAPVEETTAFVEAPAVEETHAAASTSKSEQDQMESPPNTTDLEQPKEKEPVQTPTSTTSPTNLGLDLFDPKAPEVEMAHKSDQPIEMGESAEEPVLEESVDERTSAVEEKLANEAVADKPAPVEETTAFVEAPAIEETKVAASTSKGDQEEMKSPLKTTDLEQPKEKEPVQTPTSATWPTDLVLDLCNPKDPEVEQAGCCVLL